MTWENEYPEGHSVEENVHVQRFPTDRPRDLKRFNRLSRDITFDIESTTTQMQETWMREQGPLSSALLQYVEKHRFRYDAFFFFGYLYATTYYALPLVEEKAFLIPLAHDEWPIRMRIWDRLFARPLSMIFNTPEERDFVQGRFPDLPIEGPIIGIGIDEAPAASKDAFRQFYDIDGPFVLYLGRIDASKGCAALIEDFQRYRQQHPTPKLLVMIGDKHMAVPADDNIIVLGPVDDGMKWNALRACQLLVMPSPHESLSLAVLEAWASERAVLVSASSSILIGQCRRAQGGLWYANYEEFEAALRLLTPQLCDRLGRQGKDFVEITYRWPAVEELYRSLLKGP